MGCKETAHMSVNMFRLIRGEDFLLKPIFSVVLKGPSNLISIIVAINKFLL